MQGIVFDIKRFAVHDGPGIRTTVFLKGCPLQCFWCHNPESMQKQPVESVKNIKLDGLTFEQNETVGRSLSVDQIVAEVRKDRIFMEESNGGVTISGGEPTMQPEFLKALLVKMQAEGLHTAVDTCGYTSTQTLKEIIPFTDLFLYDLKHIEPGKHKAATGKSNEAIIENLDYLLKAGKKVFVRIPVIPGFNYSDTEMNEMLNLLKSFTHKPQRVDLLPYHNIAQNKYKRFGLNNTLTGTPSIIKEELTKYKEIYEEQGFAVKIGG